MKNFTFLILTFVNVICHGQISIQSVLKKASKCSNSKEIAIHNFGDRELHFQVFTFSDFQILKPIDQSSFNGFLVKTDSNYFYFDLYRQEYDKLKKNVQSVNVMDTGFVLKTAYFFNNSIFTGKSEFTHDSEKVFEVYKTVGAPAIISLTKLHVDRLESETNYFKDRRYLNFYPYRTTYEKSIKLGVSTNKSFWLMYNSK